MSLKESVSSFVHRIRGGNSQQETDSDSENQAPDDDGDGEWSIVETPTSKSLHDVVQTVEGPYVVGAEGNVFRRNEGSWDLRIDSGPATKHNTLTAIDVTSDGKRVWFAGSSGALGMYDIETGQKYDYSAPEERTSTWEAIAVTDADDDERLRVANGSGEVFPITIDENGCPQYGDAVKPGSGSTIPALDFGGGTPYAIDTSGNVFVEAEEDWEDIGIQNAQVNFFDLYADEETLLVAGGDGRIYRYDRPCENWTPVSAGSVALHGIDQSTDETIAVGAEGRIYHRVPSAGWEPISSPTEADLRAVALGEVDVAIGAGGIVLER